ncbi:MAG: Fic family protein [Alphaproteobacteria bacterium]|nr:Fic family protein [Alphaproteobacteria bacterium]
MPGAALQQDLDKLVELIGADTAGMSIDAIASGLGGNYHRRTLQRRLALLVEQERIERIGEGRGIRYRRSSATRNSTAQVGASSQAPTGDYIGSISAEGSDVRSYVSRPLHLRRPVGYQVEFLEQYHPNHTAYLSQDLRAQLHDIGRSPMAQTPAGTFARDILNRLLIDLSWASSHLEGNTYSRLDTERLIDHGQAAEGKDAFETQMILNHKQAIEYLVLTPEQPRVNTDTFLALHAFLADGLMANPAAIGHLRRRAVAIGGSVYQPLGLPQPVADLFDIVVQTAAEITDPFEQSFFLMVHIPYLQPFEDVNKRVSRLAANIPFINHNLCPLSFIDVPQRAYVDAMLGVYELNRIELLRDVFVWAYERSCQQYVAIMPDLVPPDPFRMRHRQALGKVISAIVREGKPATADAVKAAIPSTVPPAEHERFVQLTLAEFATLRASNAVRFGIHPFEFSAWQSGNP